MVMVKESSKSNESISFSEISIKIVSLVHVLPTSECTKETSQRMAFQSKDGIAWWLTPFFRQNSCKAMWRRPHMFNVHYCHAPNTEENLQCNRQCYRGNLNKVSFGPTLTYSVLYINYLLFYSKNLNVWWTQCWRRKMVHTCFNVLIFTSFLILSYPLYKQCNTCALTSEKGLWEHNLGLFTSKNQVENAQNEVNMLLY